MASVPLIIETQSRIGLGPIPPEAKASTVSSNFEILGNTDKL